MGSTSATEEEIRAVIGWVTATADAPSVTGPVQRCRAGGEEVWVLAWCTDSIVWGHASETELVLALSDLIAPPIPRPTSSTLVELRIFGAGAELLVWGEPGSRVGRWLEERGTRSDGPLAPAAASAIALGFPETNHFHERDGFTLLADGAGDRHLVPLAVEPTADGMHPLVIDLVHHFEQHPESGVVRIAATRFVGIRPRGDRELFAAIPGGSDQ